MHKKEVFFGVFMALDPVGKDLTLPTSIADDELLTRPAFFFVAHCPSQGSCPIGSLVARDQCLRSSEDDQTRWS